MPLNNRRVIQIVLDQVDVVDEKCEGYRNMIKDALTDLIDYERDHMINGTNIQQRITAKCRSAGEWFSKQKLSEDKDAS